MFYLPGGGTPGLPVSALGRLRYALAGGVCATFPQKTGYYYHEGGISSPDGHCRPFDAAASGTVLGRGLGLVVLKRYADAVAEGDNIRAVILAPP